MAGVHRITLKNLQPDIKNSLILGIIINKQDVRIFQAKNTSFTPGERAVWNFTIRDTEVDFANVTVWGSKEYIERLCASFGIGQVVELVNPKITIRRREDKGEGFVPSVSCQCNITLNQGVSDMHTHNAPDRVQFAPLLSLPTKNPSNVTSLADALKSIELLKGQHIDVMVVLMSMSSTNHLITKDGRAVVCRDIDVNDGSVDKPTSFRLWGTDWVGKSEFWQPRHTVLFLADVHVAFNEFKKLTLMTIGRKTLITENPNIPQTHIVRASVRHLPDQPLGAESSTPDLNSVTSVMTIRDISERVEREKSNPDKVPFTTLAHVTINQINFDDKSIVVERCALCKKWVQPEKESCINPNCACGNGSRTPLNVSNFNLKLNLRDRTGCLVACRLVGSVAEDFLKCSVKDFKTMSEKDRQELKWKCLLENCVVVLQVVGPTPPKTFPIYNILSVKRELENERLTDTSDNNGLYS